VDVSCLLVLQESRGKEQERERG